MKTFKKVLVAISVPFQLMIAAVLWFVFLVFVFLFDW